MEIIELWPDHARVHLPSSEALALSADLQVIGQSPDYDDFLHDFSITADEATSLARKLTDALDIPKSPPTTYQDSPGAARVHR